MINKDIISFVWKTLSLIISNFYHFQEIHKTRPNLSLFSKSRILCIPISHVLLESSLSNFNHILSERINLNDISLDAYEISRINSQYN